MNAEIKKFALELIETQAAVAEANPKDKEQAAYVKGLRLMYEFIVTELWTKPQS